MEIKECPICGCKEIGQGIMQGMAQMQPLHNFFGSSELIADVCTNCGYIIAMRVKNPQNFKNKKK